MAVYAAYHPRFVRNRLTHFIGVPAIVFAILIPMCWGSDRRRVTLAHVFLVPFSRTTSCSTVRLAIVDRHRDLGALLCRESSPPVPVLPRDGSGPASSSPAAGSFQLVGHSVEGRKPALADNLFQIFIAPIFLVAELFFALGLKREVREKVEARLESGA